ncbi:hypothetical protein D6853_06125 [Butyrivibrio sp. X503]|uniref:permease prefix domain 1-containing protein n=1 Tax=Butyrivibrio sp. X503 TaxID=2364878 RepID=UPI000EA91D19|nr:permease prefix domain 1-containing protein [Butyrivibrio sp. X503]RKM56367.1 hypothetical protein D6853_06125 [Butyrivibrio sp. X503]
METIRNYLETMFANLPNTMDVLKAKNELYQMMEDKYEELIAEGKHENEAVGIIISEFGNLEELADTLGIGGVINNNVDLDTRLVTDDEAMEYVFEASQHKLLIGVGVMLFIISPIFPILITGSTGSLGGVVGFFITIAVGVAILILSSARMGKWSFLDNLNCVIEYATANALYAELRNNMLSKALMKTIGIMCIILSFIPVIILDELTAKSFFGPNMAPASLFIMVGIGVLLIIASTAKDGAYNKLLSLNDSKKVAGNYDSIRSTQHDYGNEVFNKIMPVYWKTVTCVYLIWSFLTFHWHRSWVIWPIAWIIHRVISTSYSDKRR